MATTAKQSSSVRSGSPASSSSSSEPVTPTNFVVVDTKDDIESIAKRISDHAEAIYQTWKAKGLAPTEILNCQSDEITTGGATSGSSIQITSHYSNFLQHHFRDKDSPVAELLAQTPDMSNNNLEKLVSSFVSEDKARQQAARKTNILTCGTIKEALKKFEAIDKNSSYGNYSPVRSSSPAKAPTIIRHQIVQTNSIEKQSKPIKINEQQQQQSPSQTQSKNNGAQHVTVPSSISKGGIVNNLSGGCQSPDNGTEKTIKIVKKEVNDHKENTVTARKKPDTPAKPANLINHQPVWPLKNRLGYSSLVNDNKDVKPSDKKLENHSVVSKVKRPVSPKKSQNLMDEVSREEERLINALKEGVVLNNNEQIIMGSETNENSSVNENHVYSKIENNSTESQDLIDSGPTGPIILNKLITWNSDRPDINNEFGSENSNLPKQIIKVRHRNDAAVPHPEVHKSLNNNLTNNKPLITNSVRPFLARGSVAERVLMFEKCPDVKLPRGLLRDPSKLPTKPSAKNDHTTLQRTIRSSKNVYIPKFHYPHGKPLPNIAVETTLQQLKCAFDSFPNNQVTKNEFTHIMKVLNLPIYWRMPLFLATPLTPLGLCDGYRFIDFWKQMSVFCHDAASRFLYILSKGQRNRPYILSEDLAPLVQDVVETHPGLAFLKEAAEFHSRYVHTVIARIFYNVNRSWTGRITLPELRRSNLLQVIQLLEEEDDINQIMAYFSYEHFYVIYCKFWELDRDHDLLIDRNDLARHNDHALSTRIIDRIFSGCVTRGTKNKKRAEVKMTYTEFVWFLLSEEDKTHPTAVEYWFRCMDLDGDGVISMYELEYFYEEQQHRMESIGIETLPYEDCLCQMLDMIKPVRPGYVTLGDLKRCRMTPIFYDTFFNLEKYLEHEQRDPFATQRDNDDMSDWDRFAAQEYELLVAEETDAQGSDDEMIEYEPDEDEYETNVDIIDKHMQDYNALNNW